MSIRRRVEKLEQQCDLLMPKEEDKVRQQALEQLLREYEEALKSTEEEEKKLP